MKNIITLSLLFIATCNTLAQTDGLSYQAIIIDPNPQELPGVDGVNNILIHTDVVFRFTVLNENGAVEYQETQNTTTNAFGMVNLTIGQGVPQTGLFTEIFWEGKKKDLQVEINIEGSFNQLSKQGLLFVPYAFHRDIIATGFLDVTGITTLGSDLTVDGTTNLNKSLSVNNNSATLLTGSLTVDNFTRLNHTLTVTNESPTALTGTLTVYGVTALGNSLEVGGDTYLKRELKVDGKTTLYDSLDVRNESPTQLTGTLRVYGITNFESDVNINQGGDLNVSGDLNIEGSTTFDGDLTVNGNTNLNNELNVNNAAPTNLSGTLVVEGATQLANNLQVLGTTNLENSLDVSNQAATNLSGTLTVQQETNLNSGLNVNNGSPTVLSGTLNVDGLIGFGKDVTIEGITNLNNSLNVNNGAATNLSGTLTVDGTTQLNNTLEVGGATTLQDELQVLNGSATNLTGSLDVLGAATLNNTLEVANASATSLTGMLTVDGETILNNTLEVANNASTELTGELLVNGVTTLHNDLAVSGGGTTQLTGTLSVDQGGFFNNALQVLNGSATTLTGTLGVTGVTTLNDALNVTGGAATNMSGALTVDGATNLNNTVTIAGATLINNDLTVTGLASLGALNTNAISVSADSPNFVATFQNTNNGNGDGIVIKLGNNHGAYNGDASVTAPVNADGYLEISAIAAVAALQGPIGVLQSKLTATNPTSLTPSDILQLVPTSFAAGAIAGIGNGIIDYINDVDPPGPINDLLPVSFPEITIPQTTLLPRTVITNSVTVPIIGLTIPGVTIPEVILPRINFTPGFELLPEIPNIPLQGITIDIPRVNVGTVTESLTKENEYVTFQDKDGRWVGAIRAQSTEDFVNNTVLDPVYVLNVAAGFVGVDLADGLATGIAEITNIVDLYNKIGVEYASGNGDYAEWLQREEYSEYITAGDIVGVKGGRITRDLTNAEQVMVVSYKPIILGNSPEKEKVHLGNNVAFMGQVPVKIIGPVRTGDFIVANKAVNGYGKAIHPNNMTAEDFKVTVGRSWDENLNEGPKMVNTVVGVHNGDWANIIIKLKQKQDAYQTKYQVLEKQVELLDQKADKAVLFNGKSK
ncbi:beta strand repeat-containing protein [Rasiella sp. SM2506]|uniref:beta strand repeat-containing protein n=1 Tax=Rasiella sp. SM2506 TaxID=3423914 RepID=UPI003D797DE5